MKHLPYQWAILFALMTMMALIMTSRSAAQRPIEVDRPANSVNWLQGTDRLVYLPFIATPSWINNVRSGARVAQIMTLVGSYPSSVLDDLWVFVVSPNGRYYPQSLDGCNGERTPKLNGQWEMRVTFGETNEVGQSFRIVLTTASSPTSQLIANTLKEWCLTNNYPGLENLPDGTTIREQLTVTRNSEVWGPAPAVSNITLPGSVTITSPHEGTLVPQEEIIQGTYTADATTDIRVLVYAADGRWYPQAYDACGGDFIHKNNGHWDVSATFGDQMSVGEPFDIVVILATPQAREILDQEQRAWCENNNYPGLLTIELPQGINEKQRIRVFRK